MSAITELATEVQEIKQELNIQKTNETEESASPDYNISEGTVTIPQGMTLETFEYGGGSSHAITTSGTGVFINNGTAVNIDFSI